MLISLLQPGRLYRFLEREILDRLPPRHQRNVIKNLVHILEFIGPGPRYDALRRRLLERRQFYPRPTKPRILPPWASSDLRDLSLNVDPLLNLESFLSSGPVYLTPPVHWSQAGHAYRKICSLVARKEYETIILVPWLKRGGADLAAIHHARLCSDEFKQITLVIATEDADSPWENRIPNNVDFLKVGSELSRLNRQTLEPELVLTRLLVQISPKRIHIINSHLAWRCIEKFGLAIHQKSRIFVSLYSDEKNINGEDTGLAQSHLAKSSGFIDAVICDNRNSVKNWNRLLGVDPSLFHVVHFPAPEMLTRDQSQLPAASKGRLLWAGRFSREKRPDLLLELASVLRDFQWDVYGEPSTKDDKNYIALSSLSNVKLHGKYDDFKSIVQDEHLAYIYTTAWDGMPNVLLEAVAAGIPIVAPDIGGISDLLPKELLLKSQACANDYVQKIESLKSDTIYKEHLEKQRSNLEKFTALNFKNSMFKVPYYFTP